MKYKHQKDIKMMLFDEHRVESDPSVLNTAFNMRDELDEVYRKAEAFDEMAEALPGYREIVLSKTGMCSTYDYMTFGNFASEVISNCESEDSQ